MSALERCSVIATSRTSSPTRVARVDAALGAELDHVVRRRRRSLSANSRTTGWSCSAVDAVDRGQRLARVVRARHEQLAELVDPLAAEPAQVDHARERVQRLRGADVVRGLLAADVLLARLQREHEAAAAVDVGRLARDPARHAAEVGLLGGEEAEARAAEVEPVAERLALADGDVDVEVAGRAQHAERQRVGLDDQQRAGLARAEQRSRGPRSRRRSSAGRRRSAATSSPTSLEVGEPVGERDRLDRRAPAGGGRLERLAAVRVQALGDQEARLLACACARASRRRRRRSGPRRPTRWRPAGRSARRSPSGTRTSPAARPG